MTGCCGNAWVVLRFDVGHRPIRAWLKSSTMSEVGISHYTVRLFDCEEDAWRVVERHHKPGQIWGVVSTQALARKLKAGRYQP